MSGEGLLMLFALPFIIAGVAAAGSVLGVAAIAGAVGRALFQGGSLAVDAIIEREEQRRIENEKWTPLVDKCKSLNNTLARIDERGKEAYKEAEDDIKESMDQLVNKLGSMEIDLSDCANLVKEEYNRSFEKIINLDTKWMSQDSDIQNEIQKSKDELKDTLDKIESSIHDFVGAQADKAALEEKLSLAYLEDGKKQLEALKDNYTIDAELLNTYKNQINEAQNFHNQRAYHSAIAITSALQMDINEKVYDLEAEKMAFEMALQYSKDLANSVKIFLNEHKVITKEVIDKARRENRTTIPHALIGMDLSVFSEKNEAGIDKYTAMQNDVNKLIESLEKADQSNCSVKKIKEISESLSSNYFPNAMRMAQQAMDNLSNYYVRVSTAEGFVDYLDEKGIDVEYYEPEDEKINPLAPISLILRDESRNEKVAFEICRSKGENERLQSEIKYHLIEGDPENESRNEYYQGLINKYLSSNEKAFKPTTMKCNKDSIGKKSGNVPKHLKEY